MSIPLLFVIAILSAYLLSSVNPAIILGKLVYRKDIRTLGSGNAGFTNFKRVFGWKFAWCVFLFDIFKTIAPGLVFAFLFRDLYGMWQIGAAVTCFAGLLGHTFPLYYGFRGGKGFLSGISALYIIDWRAGLIGTGVFLLLLFTIKYMSVASMCGVVTGALSFFFLSPESPIVPLFACLSAALIVFQHRTNIVRLAHKEESKFSLFGKKKKDEEK